MFRFHDELKVYLHRDPVDFRCGINSLSILVERKRPAMASRGVAAGDQAVIGVQR